MFLGQAQGRRRVVEAPSRGSKWVMWTTAAARAASDCGASNLPRTGAHATAQAKDRSSETNTESLRHSWDSLLQLKPRPDCCKCLGRNKEKGRRERLESQPDSRALAVRPGRQYAYLVFQRPNRALSNATARTEHEQRNGGVAKRQPQRNTCITNQQCVNRNTQTWRRGVM